VRGARSAARGRRCRRRRDRPTPVVRGPAAPTSPACGTAGSAVGATRPAPAPPRAGNGRRRRGRAPRSSTATAPTCMGVSGRSRCRKLSSSAVRRSYPGSAPIGRERMTQTVGSSGPRHDVTRNGANHHAGALEQCRGLGAVVGRVRRAAGAQTRAHQLQLVGPLIEERDPLLHRRRERIGWPDRAEVFDRVALLDDDSGDGARRGVGRATWISERRNVDVHDGLVAPPADLTRLARVHGRREARVPPAAATYRTSHDRHGQPAARSAEPRLRPHRAPLPFAPRRVPRSGRFGTLPSHTSCAARRRLEKGGSR